MSDIKRFINSFMKTFDRLGIMGRIIGGEHRCDKHTDGRTKGQFAGSPFAKFANLSGPENF